MIVFWKKENSLVKNFKQLAKEKKINYTFYKKPSFFAKIGLVSHNYPDIYFHSAPLDKDSLELIKKSKITIVNNSILKDRLIEKYDINKDKIKVIFPAIETKKFKKNEIQSKFLKEYNLDEGTRIIYFKSNDFIKDNFNSFCDILSKLEATNFKAFVTYKNKSELQFGAEIAKQKEVLKYIKFIENDIFEYSDIFIYPTNRKSFSQNILKAMANKNAVFLTNNNYAIDLLDVFAIMDSPNDSNVPYRVDMLLRVEDELRKIQKENYDIAKKLNDKYQIKKLQKLIG